MAYKLFVSYATADLAIVDKLREFFAEAEISVFAAEYNVVPGSPLSPTIEKAIRDCDLFLLLWSSRSRASDWVGQEIGLAKGQKKTILPVVLEPDLQLPGFISDLKYLAAHKNPERALAWLKKNIFSRAAAKDKQEGLVWLGLGAGLVWLLSQGDQS
jgi:hypothetical protein